MAHRSILDHLHPREQLTMSRRGPGTMDGMQVLAPVLKGRLARAREAPPQPRTRRYARFLVLGSLGC